MHAFSLFPFRRFSSWISPVAFFVVIIGCGDQAPTEPGRVRAVSNTITEQGAPAPNVTFAGTIQHDVEAGTISGTWQSTGAFVDHGTIEFTGFAIRGGPPLFSSGLVFAKSIMHGQRGSFEMHSREHWILHHDARNTWVIGHGTGDYEKLEGHGTIVVTLPTDSAPGSAVSSGYVRFK